MDKTSVTLSCGNATYWEGSGVDLVFTHPYAPLPRSLIGKPSIINLFGDKKKLAEGWLRAELKPVSRWGKDLANTLYVANMVPVPMNLTRLHEDNTGLLKGGWFPLELATTLLTAYGTPGMTVWDGFMGRGTVGKACQQLGMNFIGIDKDPNRVEIAKRYLGL